MILPAGKGNMTIPYGRQNIDHDDIKRINTSVGEGWNV